jgi:hypothetical protein
MKLLSFKHIFILGALLAAGSVQVHAADEVTGKSEELELTDSIVHDTLVLADGKLTRYDRRIMRYRKHWNLLIPTSGIIQTCGNMGIISLGIGWEYGKRRQWETQLLFGYIPKFSSDDEKLTMTLKENFIPWRRNIGEAIVVTQEVDDIISSPVVKESIINNSDCKILLDQRKYMNKFDQIQALLGLTEKEKSQILSINMANNPSRLYKEVWIGLGGTQSAVYATEVSAEEYLAYTTEETEKVEVYRLAEKLGDDIEAAIRQLAERRRNKE